MYRFLAKRLYSNAPVEKALREKSMKVKLTEALKPSVLQIDDISGGCGALYSVEIVSNKFKGLSRVKQHQMVNEILKDEIKGFHGIRITTSAE